MDNDLRRTASTVSLLEDPSKLQQTPNFLTSLLFDRYWKRPTSKWIKRADEIYNKQAELAKKGIEISGSDKERIHKFYTIVQESVEVYSDFVKAKKPGEARRMFGRVRDGVLELQKISSESSIKATRMKALLDAYSKISDRTKPMSLLSADRYSYPCDLCIRRKLVMKLIDWFEKNHERRRILWLRGKRGSGKTVILRHIAKRMDERNALAASFVFTDDLKTHQDLINHFIATILGEITKYIPTFQKALGTICSKLQDDSVFAKTIRKQTQELFIAGFSLLPDEERRSPLMIVLDGLDVCDFGALDALFEFLEQSLEAIPTVYFALASSSSEGSRWVDAMLSRKSLIGQVEEIEVDDHMEARSTFLSSYLGEKTV